MSGESVRKAVPTVDAIAISICLAARTFTTVHPSAEFDATTKRYHPNRCRFCARPIAELTDELDRFGIRAGAQGVFQTEAAVEALTEWAKQSASARMSRLREAQRTQWFEEVSL